MGSIKTVVRSLLCLSGSVMLAACAGPGPLLKGDDAVQGAFKDEAMHAWRLVADLRAEGQAVRQEVGAARAAQSRLEGELRDARRKLAEARRLVEMQREELASAKDDRERVATATRELEGQLTELGGLRQRLANAEGELARVQQEAATRKKAPETGNPSVKAPAKPAPPGKPSSPNQGLPTAKPGVSSQGTGKAQPNGSRGGLARKHDVDVVR